MPKLAHISDLHFGPSFNLAIWKNVRSQIKKLEPDVLIASGDFVDHPNPFRLLAAKSELLDLCKEIGSAPELFVVPGNHDVSYYGNIWSPFGSRWFERIFFNDTSQLRAHVERKLKIKIGLNEDSLSLSFRQKLRWAFLRGAIRRHIKDSCDKRVQSCSHRGCAMQWPTESVHKKISITCFDSNPSGLKSLFFATGHIHPDQLVRVGSKRERNANCSLCAASTEYGNDPSALLRVAVLHHHALPIALPQETTSGRLGEEKVEPFLLLRNSGDFLHKLQNNNYDLVLHGHKHKQQFAQFELQSPRLKPYRVLVLAGGSAAHKGERPEHNTLRLIRMSPNGQLAIQTFEEGIQNDQETYQESVLQLKTRAFHRALERAKRQSDIYHIQEKIDEVGNIRTTYRITELTATADSSPITQIPYRISTEKIRQGFFHRITPEPEFRDRIKVMWRDRSDKLHELDQIPEDLDGGCYSLLPTQPIEPGADRGLTYGVTCGTANSIAMTTWELRQRKVDDPMEALCHYISHPTRLHIMELQVPRVLDQVTPRLRCLRHKDYPNFPLTFRTDCPPIEYSDFEADEWVQEQEASNLKFNALTRTWRLEVHYPLVGYLYELAWEVPNIETDRLVEGRTKDNQSTLLGLALRQREERISRTDAEALRQFADFANSLKQRFRSQNPNEKQAVFLMVYDVSDQQLHSVMASQPQPDIIENVIDEIKAPLGSGVAGAAFLQRQVLAWREDRESDSLIVPTQIPSMDAKHVLALPIYYQRQSDEPEAGQLVLTPGAVLGVVTLASDANGSEIVRCEQNDREGEQLSKEAQTIAQYAVTEILRKLTSNRDR